MKVTITSGDHDPPHSFVVVDNHGLLVDLSGLGGMFIDKSIAAIEWRPVLEGETTRDRGDISRKGGIEQTSYTQRFYDFAVLQPALDLYNKRKRELLGVT